MLLDWLALIGLISVEGEHVHLLEALPSQHDKPDAKPDQERARARSTGTGAEVSGSTKDQRRETPQPEPVLSFGFSFSLTADDLASLSPEQIEATFAAVGKLMAIRPH